VIPIVLISAIAWLIGGAGDTDECRGAGSAPALSHVVLAVDDLEKASAGFSQLGFRLKDGRLHANNLLNRHVKFRDGSGIEMMAVQGAPGDAMAQRYAALAEAGGGVYVALDVNSAEAPIAAASLLGLEVQRSSSGSWQFVAFPDTSPAAAVFFAIDVPLIQDTDSLVSHAMEVHGLSEAWLEGGAELVSLLRQLGAADCGTVQGPAGRTGHRLGLSRGTLVIVPGRTEARPRVLGVTLSLSAPGEGIVWPASDFWIRYDFERNGTTDR
jgi:hypothetical protein